MNNILKIKLLNFKRFNNFEVYFDPKLNIIVGDNESGKSSLLEAIDITLSGSRHKVETKGLENLFNATIISDFLNSDRKYENLPKLFVELYLSDQFEPDLNGKNNSDIKTCDGLKFECYPNDKLGKEIKEILKDPEAIFPFEFYSINFNTFSGDAYSSYKKYLKHLVIDNSQMNSEYAIREYVKDIYSSISSPLEKNKHHNNYRKHKDDFRKNTLVDMNSKLDGYEFLIRNNSKSNLETDLALSENKINIENKGKGIQCFIKTKFALNRGSNAIELVLLEEPENHLSHLNMKKMIELISSADNKQIFISTHSNSISARLDLRKSILLNSNSTSPILLKDIDESTAKFFIKAPDKNLLDFVLSKKVILVEGDAEFILMEALYKNCCKDELHNSDITILSVDGTSFKRYLEIAKKLNIKTAVIRDNDGKYQENCVDNYSEFTKFQNISIFSDLNNANSTFEICLYNLNKNLCDNLFKTPKRKLEILDYMLNNKAEVAYELLDKKASDIVVPTYIKDAIAWIRK
ncbi:putative ATP-dependent endonuclease of OLD family [Flavobacterium sp. 270]|uniref:ATP-dependent nuclease n=1 Tax=Flavobacterium sp. 270 TaxID=2512114 RepID=UPI0010646A01|nr:TOPRIM nucleotidyl transferase/hydrolase domain-containing protein [Flavobacterium sp. 270]TDW51818.1 putative ATP-dependent endonuclease of OLD family [Flavobacterium sp. 270]